jgi:hypothetical protein
MRRGTTLIQPNRHADRLSLDNGIIPVTGTHTDFTVTARKAGSVHSRRETLQPGVSSLCDRYERHFLGSKLFYILIPRNLTPSHITCQPSSSAVPPANY